MSFQAPTVHSHSNRSRNHGFVIFFLFLPELLVLVFQSAGFFILEFPVFLEQFIGASLFEFIVIGLRPELVEFQFELILIFLPGLIPKENGALPFGNAPS